MENLIERVAQLNCTLRGQEQLFCMLTEENFKRMERLHACTLEYIKLLKIPRYLEGAGLSKKSSVVVEENKKSAMENRKDMVSSKPPKMDMVSMDSKGVVLKVGHGKKTDVPFEESQEGISFDELSKYCG